MFQIQYTSEFINNIVVNVFIELNTQTIDSHDY